ncbi:MAG: copper amine oxidase N-terminal domain-containing protein [Defluviitaleaceae bacterium]|nr:copper amine oxidase N-terminal domain-containing protein [Defluviitaleaceae bacterium]
MLNIAARLRLLCLSWMGLTYRNPLVEEYFGDLVWDRAPIADRSVPAVITLPELDPNMRVVRFVIEDTAYTVDRIPHESDVAPFIDPAYERTMVPLRYVVETFGATIGWDGRNLAVYIYQPVNPGQSSIGKLASTSFFTSKCQTSGI